LYLAYYCRYLLCLMLYPVQVLATCSFLANGVFWSSHLMGGERAACSSLQPWSHMCGIAIGTQIPTSAQFYVLYFFKKKN